MGFGDLFGVLGHLFGGGGGSKKDPYADLLSQLNPLIDQNKQISSQAGTAGLLDTGNGKDDLNYVSDYLKSLLHGSDDEILKLFDSSEITAGIDNNVEQISSLAPRGGRRAASIGQSYFDRDSSINRILEQLRLGAPDKLSGVAQALANVGLGEISASTGAGAQASNVLFGVQDLRQQDKDRKAQLIGSILGAVGSVAGAVACVSIWGSKFHSPIGKIPANKLQVGDELYSYTKNGDLCIRKVIRIRIKERQITRIITNGDLIIRPTLTHEFCDQYFERGTICGALESEDLLSIVNGKNDKVYEKPITILDEEKNDVLIVKLDDEEESYPFIVNGYVSFDDDILPEQVVENAIL